MIVEGDKAFDGIGSGATQLDGAQGCTLAALGLQVRVDEVKTAAPGGGITERDEEDLVPRIGDNARGLGVDALEEVVVTGGVGDEHGEVRSYMDR